MVSEKTYPLNHSINLPAMRHDIYRHGLAFLIGAMPLFSGCIMIEPLAWPQRVVGRQGTTLKLSNGKTVNLPDVERMEEQTPYLDAACARGVEVSNGRVYGQMRIWHWCGNDIVFYDLARVDLSHLVIYEREAVPSIVIHDSQYNYPGGNLDLTQWGWNIRGHRIFKWWEEDQRRLASDTASGATTKP